jgi:hypothetical protein
MPTIFFPATMRQNQTAPSARDVIAGVVYDTGRDFEAQEITGESVADAILAALSAAGWAVVPKEASFEMLSAGGASIWDHASLPKHQLVANAYRAMVAAADPGEKNKSGVTG